MWNHRILETEYIVGDEIHYTYGMHECYYDKNDKIFSWTTDPEALVGDTLEDLKLTLGQMIKCMRKPVLKAKNLPEEGAQEIFKEFDKEVTTLVKAKKTKEEKPKRGGCKKC